MGSESNKPPLVPPRPAPSAPRLEATAHGPDGAASASDASLPDLPRPPTGSWPEISSRYSSVSLLDDPPSSRQSEPYLRHSRQSAADAASLRRITTRLEALPVAALKPPAVDPRTCALAALMVANHVSARHAEGPFAALEHAGLMEVHALSDLPVLARFVLRILPKLGPDFIDLPTVAPPDLENACRSQRAELLEMAQAHLSDIDEAHGRMATVRLGRTAADVVSDLRTLADLCQDYGSELARRASYTPALGLRSRELAGRLEEALLGPEGPEAREWRTYLLRAWSTLVATYAEVQRAGRFLFPEDKPEARYPSLSAVQRVRRRVKRESVMSEPQLTGHGPVTLPFPIVSSPELALVEDGTARSSRDEAGVAALFERHGGPPSTADVGAALGGARSDDFLVYEDPFRREAFPPEAPFSQPTISGTISQPTISHSGPLSQAVPPSQQGTPSSDGFFSAGPVAVGPRLTSPSSHSSPSLPPAAHSVPSFTNLEDRLPVALDVSFYGESNFYGGLGGEIEGLFVATFVVKPAGTPLVLTLTLPGAGALQILGTVQWVREFSPDIETSPGMGVVFDRLSEVDRGTVRRFVEMRPPLFYEA